MKIRLSLFSLLAAALPWAHSQAAAEVVLSQVRWQLLPSKQSGIQEAKEITTLSRPPDTRVGPALGAEAVLRNDGPKSAVGVLLRYTVEAKIVAVGAGPGAAGTWTVPFWWEEGHVPQIAAGKEKRFAIRDLNLETYLKRLLSEGFWPTALRIRVMVEPRRGDDLAQMISESELPVSWDGTNK